MATSCILRNGWYESNVHEKDCDAVMFGKPFRHTNMDSSQAARHTIDAARCRSIEEKAYFQTMDICNFLLRAKQIKVLAVQFSRRSLLQTTEYIATDRVVLMASLPKTQLH